MALRQRKDVQKASYYVWFLGAQEAKELRGNRVLMSTIPRLIERSKEQEPLKVTLQISQKGLKIIQGTAKHFIPHSAITCSIQSDDIVACVLLLYNPATKCPLHVHAYRCDSDTTAQALHEQLQILINKPDNQKRFAELETRLGKSIPVQQIQQQQQQSQSMPSLAAAPNSKVSKRFEMSPRRFDSSLGSDTGTSTRESECSEEHSPSGPLSPVDKPVHLYDSLAAELRAKLNGNGPPLLLPPRDYDTVHRSQGNLAAIELRRCRNTCIVGGDAKHPTPTKLAVVSSRGSSGIGSDLAPSPERQEQHSSSDDDWNTENREPMIALQTSSSQRRNNIKTKPHYADESLSPTRFRDNPPSYIYPKDPNTSNDKKFQRNNSREEEKNSQKSSNSREEEVKPIITKQVHSRFQYSSAANEEEFIDRRKYEGIIKQKAPVYIEDERKPKGLMRQQSERYRQATEVVDINRKNYQPQQSPPKYKMKSRDYYERERDYNHENLTDRQKYRELTDGKYESSSASPPSIRHVMYRGEEVMEKRPVMREYSPERVKTIQRPAKNSERYSYERDDYFEAEQHHEKSKPRYRPAEQDHSEFVDRNPYREPESIPYRESIEKMMKSPVMRYKSNTQQNDAHFQKYENAAPKSHPKYKDEKKFERSPSPTPAERERYRVEMVPRSRPIPAPQPEIVQYPTNRRVEKDKKVHMESNVSPMSTMKKVSPKDRFLASREHFQAMDSRIRLQQEPKQVVGVRRSEPSRHEIMEQQPQSYSQPRHHPQQNGWSSEDELPQRGHDYREIPQQQRYPGLDKHQQQQQQQQQQQKQQAQRVPRMAPAKSLSNLTKGYRHSYAEPMQYCGRVGLAAINPY